MKSNFKKQTYSFNLTKDKFKKLIFIDNIIIRNNANFNNLCFLLCILINILESLKLKFW